MYGIFGLILSTRHQLRSRRSPRHQLPQELFCGWLTDGLVGVGWLTDGLGGVFSLIRSPRHQLRSRRSPRHQLLKTPAPKASVTQAHRQQITLRRPRSEEHTSELQSLMRISFGVLCLKKKNKK